MSAAESVRVERDEAGHRWVAYVDEDALATLTFRERDGVMNLLHTEVDPRARGRGIGDALVRQVLDQLRAAGTKIIPTCPYVRAWLERHEDYRDLVAPREG